MRFVQANWQPQFNIKTNTGIPLSQSRILKCHTSIKNRRSKGKYMLHAIKLTRHRLKQIKLTKTWGLALERDGNAIEESTDKKDAAIFPSKKEILELKQQITKHFFHSTKLNLSLSIWNNLCRTAMCHVHPALKTRSVSIRQGRKICRRRHETFMHCIRNNCQFRYF